MDTKIISFLRDQLNKESKWCMDDFEKYDVPALVEYDGPFLWRVYLTGTRLLKISPKCVESWYATERTRFCMFQHIDLFFSYFELKAIDFARIFYYDGKSIKLVDTEEQARMIYRDAEKYFRERAIAEYAEEFINCNKPLEIRFMSEDTEKRYRESLEYAKSLGDTSLQDCVNRLSHWSRQALNHYMAISYDFTEHGYCFCEIINDKPHINGGIIMSRHAEKNRWSIHT